jgi:hypothetical protein
MLGVTVERAGTDNCYRIVKLCGIGRGWQRLSFGIYFLVVGHNFSLTIRFKREI